MQIYMQVQQLKNFFSSPSVLLRGKRMGKLFATRKNDISSFMIRTAVLVLIFMFFYMTGALAVGGDEGKDIFVKAENLMKKGKYCSAEKVLLSQAQQIKDAEKLKSYLAVIHYQRPDWYEGDVSQLKKYGKYSFPLMTTLVNSPPPADSSQEQAEWINRSRVLFINALTEAGYEKSADTLIKLLEAEEVRIRIASILGLEKLGARKAIMPLYDYLREEHIPDFSETGQDILKRMQLEKLARAHAIAALASFEDPSLIPQLKQEIERRDSPDRKTAAAILTGYRSARLWDQYVKMLEDPDDDVRIYAASALKDIGDERGLGVILDIFKKSAPSRKLWIMGILKGWKSPKTASFLLEYLKKEAEKGRFDYVPMTVMGRVYGAARVGDPDTQLVMNVVETVINWSDLTIGETLKILEKGPEKMRYLATEILGQTRATEAVPVIRKNLSGKDPLLSYYSIWALGKIGDVESKSKISSVLDSDNVHLKAAAAWALAAMDGDKRSLSAAYDLLKKKEKDFKKDALEIIYLVRDKDSAQKVYDTLCETSFADIKKKCAIILGLIEDTASLSILENLSKSVDFTDSYYPAEAVFRMTGDAVEFEYDRENPANFQLYGAGKYCGADYLRVLMTYLSLFPEKFGEVDDFSLAYLTPVRTYGEFGKEISTNSSIPLKTKRDSSDENPIILDSGQPVILLKREGTQAKICTMEGRTGWVPASSLRIIEKTVDATLARFRQDLGLHFSEDLSRMIEDDYLTKGSIEVRFTQPWVAQASVFCNFSSKLALTVSGLNPRDFNVMELAEEMDRSDKVIEVKTALPPESFKIILDQSGKLKKVIIKESGR